MIRVELSAADVSHLLLAENFLDSTGIHLIENLRYQETQFKDGTIEGTGSIDALTIDTNRYMQHGCLELNPAVSARNSSNFSVDSMQLQLTSGEDAPHSDEWDNLSLVSHGLDDMSINNLFSHPFMTSGLTSASTSPVVPADVDCSEEKKQMPSTSQSQPQSQPQPQPQPQTTNGMFRSSSPAV
jgi:hypothetical protein